MGTTTLKTKLEDTTHKASVWEKINAGATLTLAVVTAVYICLTFNIVKITSNQMILSAEPNIDLETSDFNQIDNGKVKFTLVNLGPVDLKEIRCYSKYYTHLIDSNLNEYTLFGGNMMLLPDFHFKKLKAKERISIAFDYTRSGLTDKKENSYFYIADLQYSIE